MLFLQFWREHIRYFAALLGSIALLTIIICFFLGMNEGFRMMYSKIITKENVYSVYQGNLACPISGVVSEKYIGIIEKIDGIRLVSPEIRQNTVLMKDFVPTILGVYPDKFIQTKKIDVAPEVWERFKKNPKGALVGKKLAGDLKKRFGSLDNKYRIPFEVVGIFDIPMSLINNTMITHKAFLNKFVAKGKNVTVINIMFDPGVDPVEMSKKVEVELNQHQKDLVCRPETAVWERVREGIAQFGDYVIWYGIWLMVFAFLLYGIMSHSFLTHNGEKEQAFIEKHAVRNPSIFRWLYLMFNFIIAVTIGGLLSYFLFISNPTPAGTDIFHPAIVVTFSLLTRILIYMFIAGTLGCLLGVWMTQSFKAKTLTQAAVFALATVVVFLMVVTFNFYLSFPKKIQRAIINGADPDNMVIVQAGTTLRQFSNIPMTVADMARLSDDIKTIDGRQLISPVIQIVANIENSNVIALAVNFDTFFYIETKIKLTDDQKPKDKFDVVVGKNVARNIDREIHVNDYLEYEDKRWRVTGIIDSGTLWDNFLFARFDDFIEVTGRETIQLVALKVAAKDKFKQVSATINEYYGLQLDELPDLPRIKIFNENMQARIMAGHFSALFFYGVMMAVTCFLAGFKMLNVLFTTLLSLKPELMTQKTGWWAYITKKLIFTAITATISAAIAYFVGNEFYFTIASATFNLQSMHPLLMGSVLLVVVISGCSALLSWRRHSKTAMQAQA